MEQIRIAVTGQSGFIGSRLFRQAAVDERFCCVEFPRSLWNDPEAMQNTLRGADVIIHLAGLSRHQDGEYLYRTNVALARILAENAPEEALLYLGSTTHEAKELPYHGSKREARRIFEKRGNCGILLMANTFGPGSRPFFNSVVSTLCHLAAAGQEPPVLNDVELPLIYVGDLCRGILAAAAEKRTGEIRIAERFTIRLPYLWEKLCAWRTGAVPDPHKPEELQLYETFCSFRQRMVPLNADNRVNANCKLPGTV